MENGKDEGGTAADGQQPKAAEHAVEFAVRTLRGDLRDTLLDLVRKLPKQWHALSESEQRDTAFHIDEQARETLLAACQVIADQKWPSLRAKLGDVKIGEKGIEAKLVVGRYDDKRHVLFDAQGSMVSVIIDEPSLFMGERGKARIDPDPHTAPLETLTPDPNEPPGDEGAAADPEAEGAQAGTRADPHELGRKAASDGKAASENPFAINTDDRDLWRQGWISRWSERSHAEAASEPGETGARDLGRQARRHGVDRDSNHFDPESQPAEFAAWCEGWDEEAKAAPLDTTPAKRGRGRPRKDPPADGAAP